MRIPPPQTRRHVPAHAPPFPRRIGRTIHTEIMPATHWYQGEGYHQQYLEKGSAGRGKQSAQKMCKDPIRCYG